MLVFFAISPKKKESIKIDDASIIALYVENLNVTYFLALLLMILDLYLLH